MVFNFSIIILFIPFLIAIFRLLNFFQTTGGRDYLYFALLFLFGAIGGVLLTIIPMPLIYFQTLSILNTNLAYFLLINIIIASTKDIQDIKIRYRFYLALLMYSIFAIILTIIQYYNQNLIFLNDLRIVSQEIIRLSVGIFTIWSFSRFDVFINNINTNRIRKIWISIGYVYFLSGIILLLLNLYLLASTAVLGIPRDNLVFIENIIPIIRLFIFFLPQAVLTLYVALLKPEFLLISHYQIITASKLYKLIKKTEITLKKNVSNSETKIDNEKLLDYLLEASKQLKSYDN
jgi:hypothetical protein